MSRIIIKDKGFIFPNSSYGNELLKMVQSLILYLNFFYPSNQPKKNGTRIIRIKQIKTDLISRKIFINPSDPHHLCSYFSFIRYCFFKSDIELILNYESL